MELSRQEISRQLFINAALPLVIDLTRLSFCKREENWKISRTATSQRAGRPPCKVAAQCSSQPSTSKPRSFRRSMQAAVQGRSLQWPLESCEGPGCYESAKHAHFASPRSAFLRPHDALQGSCIVRLRGYLHGCAGLHSVAFPEWACASSASI